MIVVCMTVWAPQGATAQSLEARNVHIEGNDEGWFVDADFSIDLGPALRDAVERGVPLYFVVDGEVRRRRWYWLDERTTAPALTVRLTYNALLRQYRLQAGAEGLAQRFDDLDDALRALGTVRGWRIGDRAAIQKGERYIVSVRMRLDGSQLPKPFQLTAITSRDWSLQAEWWRVPVQP